MRRRIIQLIGGLLVVAAMAVVPSAASAGDPSQCQDRWSPHSRWGHGWYGHDGNGRYWRGWDDGRGYFDGSSWDPYCSASDRLGKVDRVMVAAQRVHGSRCENLRRSGRLGIRRTCSHIHWMEAHGTRHWHHAISRALPPGRYRLHHRAIDRNGNRGFHHTTRLAIR
jgi:hypothetical protein